MAASGLKNSLSFRAEQEYPQSGYSCVVEEPAVCRLPSVRLNRVPSEL